MNITNHLLVEMKLSGIIGGDNNMEWRSPNGDYTFIISRYDNILPYGPRYTIEIKVINITGVVVYTTKFSELDALRIVDSMTEFNRYYFETFSDMIIYTTVNNKLNEGIIYLQKDLIDGTDPKFIDSNGSIRDCLLELEQYNQMKGGSLQKIVSIYCSQEELDELIFSIYFSGLLGTVVDGEYERQLIELSNKIDI